MTGGAPGRSAVSGERGSGGPEFDALWKEEPTLSPPASFTRQSNERDRSIDERFAPERFPGAFEEYAELLQWDRRWERVLDDHAAPFYRWFVGGRLNASVSCVDRHATTDPDRVAFWFVPEEVSASPVAIRYGELLRRVNELASVLAGPLGLRAGDRATLHLPMTPELPIAMLACARLGVIHSVVFAGFSGEACGQRLADSSSRVLLTMDTFDRGGRRHDHKATADRAFEVSRSLGHPVETVLVFERRPGEYGSAAPFIDGRDRSAGELLRAAAGATVPPVPMPSEAPLFLMYTSGTTGRPKGVQHGTGGYLAYVAGTTRLFLDLHPSDVYWCLADIGWITGHSYLVYGPLALGGTSVLFEGMPTYPDAERPWWIAERLGVTILYTSPTAIRQFRKMAPEGPLHHSTRFKLLGTVGEPIEPESWRWYYDVVGRGSAVVVDTWWQTETGGILCATKPGIDPMKPGSAGPMAPGIRASIWDDDGAEVPRGSGRAGNLVIRSPWPGMMQTIWGDPDRFRSTYFARFPRPPGATDWPYFASDAAVEAADGYVRILGRVDDVIKVAGHRLGTKEIESACLTVPGVAEAAVVPVLDEVRGHLPEVYLSLRPDAPSAEEVEAEVREAIEGSIGKIARPRAVRVVPDLPKTRSGKILRRVLSALSDGRDPGDVSTLANPEVVEQIRRSLSPPGRP